MNLPSCFPTPYPDEALYSIFCRYHVRSGNATDSATLHQLFDQKRSLHTTVLSPFPMRYASQWPDSFDGFSRDSILMNHTAYPFYRAFHFCSNDARSSYAADRFFMAMYNNCCTESKKLRYCPMCAQAQWQNLGASYWQILPQINGYEICPLHNVPIRETNISHRDIRYNFFPASNVLGKPEPGDDDDHITRVKENRKEFLQMALDISFLYRYSYYGFNLGAKIQKVLQYDLLPCRHNWVRTVLTDPVIFECGDERGLDVLEALVYDPYQLISQIQYVNVCIQLRICRAMFGDIETFCNARIKL